MVYARGSCHSTIVVTINLSATSDNDHGICLNSTPANHGGSSISPTSSRSGLCLAFPGYAYCFTTAQALRRGAEKDQLHGSSVTMRKFVTMTRYGVSENLGSMHGAQLGIPKLGMVYYSK